MGNSEPPKHLVAPKEKNDFEFLATKPCWSGKRLRALLEHVQTPGGASSLRRAP
jgi:hypothetical protein